jgi:hypothetical protein
MNFGESGKYGTGKSGLLVNIQTWRMLFMTVKKVRVDDIFDEKKIDKNMTLDKFKKERKQANIPIEDFILKERYGQESE